MKRTLSAIMAIALLATVSCGGSDSSQTETTTSASGETTTAAPEVDLYTDLPTGDYTGYTFKVIGPKSSDYTWAQITAEEEIGEPVNDAVYKRNIELEDKLGVKVEYIEDGNAYSKLQSSVMADDDAYDAGFYSAYKLGPNAASGYILDLNLLDKIDLDKPWWDKNTAEQYEIGGKKYMLHGDLHYGYIYCMWTYFFNQQMIEDYKLESPYELVKSGNWTLDKLDEYCRAVMQDVDNDGAYTLALDNSDICGIVSNGSSFLGLLHGAGESLITKDSSGDPQFIGLTDRFSKVYDKLLEIVGDSGVFTEYGTLTNPERFGLFASDRFLFSAQMLGSAEQLREMPNDFGILPLPKYDSEQENYYSYIGPSACVLFIPTSCKDLDRTGTILENMCALSYETVRPAYFETTLQEKLLRDETAKEMIDIIFSNIDAELGYVYGFAGIQNTFMDALKASSGIASEFESVKSKVVTAIDNYLANIEG